MSRKATHILDPDYLAALQLKLGSKAAPRRLTLSVPI